MPSEHNRGAPIVFFTPLERPIVSEAVIRILLTECPVLGREVRVLDAVA